MDKILFKNLIDKIIINTKYPPPCLYLVFFCCLVSEKPVSEEYCFINRLKEFNQRERSLLNVTDRRVE